MQMSFVCMRIKNNFRVNSFALSLALRHTLQFKMFICYFQQRGELRRQVTMVANFLDLTLSWQRRPFAFSNDGRKLWATVLLLVQSCTGKSYMFFFYVFSVISAGPRFVEIQKFCYHGNVKWRLLFSIMRLAGARSETKRFSELLISLIIRHITRQAIRIFREFSEWQNLSSVSASPQQTALRWKSPPWFCCKPEFDFPVAIPPEVP